MPRFKRCDTTLKMLPVDFLAQILPGSFEHALCTLVDQELDLSGLTNRFCNDKGGAPAYPPAVLLKIVLLAYSRGMISSRRIARACQENVLFMAVSGDLAPHFTTIAEFVALMGDEIAPLFEKVLLVCDQLGLIGRDLFAIDGVKLPSNASKARSGTRAELAERSLKARANAEVMLARHREQDALKDGGEAERHEREKRSVERLLKEAKEIDQWLSQNPSDRKGPSGGVRKSNLTDNESAKMATSKGVIQGYTGVAVVDAAAQIVVAADAFGTGSEQELLLPMIDAAKPMSHANTVHVADAGYHSIENVNALEERQCVAYVCDTQYRKRDPRYADQEKHQAKPDPLYNKTSLHTEKSKSARQYRPRDFVRADDDSHCICPAGQRLDREGREYAVNGHTMIRFKGHQESCSSCQQRQQCLRYPDKTPVRQVTFCKANQAGTDSATSQGDSAVARMRRRIDSEQGKQMIGARFATVEPVFGNLRANKQLNRFTLRGQKKVSGQWKLMCLLHNIEKLAHHGYASRR